MKKGVEGRGGGMRHEEEERGRYGGKERKSRRGYVTVFDWRLILPPPRSPFSLSLLLFFFSLSLSLFLSLSCGVY